MKTAALVTLAIASLGFVAGLFPCVGWLNWVVVPFCAVPVLVGVAGMITDKDPESPQTRNLGVYLAAIIGGVLLSIAAGVRCALGGGVV